MNSDEGRVHYGVARVELHLPGVRSLKEKRSIVRRAVATLRDDLGCSVAEVGAQNLWQRTVLGVAMAASTATGVDRVLDRIRRVVERDARIEVLSVAELADHLEPDTIDLSAGPPG